MMSISQTDAFTAIVDMGLIWRLAAPNTEDREKSDGSKYTWGDYREQVVLTVMRRHRHAERIIV